MAEQLKTIPLAEAVERAKADPKALGMDELIARHAQSAKESEEKYGPQVPPFMPRRGRPRRGEVSVVMVKSKAVKMPPAFWELFQAIALKEGLSVHSAIRIALLDYVAKKQA